MYMYTPQVCYVHVRRVHHVHVGGSFDIADRTFRNLETTWWLSSSESATDVKELIPEFFYLPEFLSNSESMTTTSTLLFFVLMCSFPGVHKQQCSSDDVSSICAGFDFGECQTGERVDHVILPPWARDSPRLFVLKHRQVMLTYYICIHVHVYSLNDNGCYSYRLWRAILCLRTFMSGWIWCLATNRLARQLYRPSMSSIQL